MYAGDISRQEGCQIWRAQAKLKDSNVTMDDLTSAPDLRNGPCFPGVGKGLPCHGACLLKEKES
jgi:hypothetical protein